MESLRSQAFCIMGPILHFCNICVQTPDVPMVPDFWAPPGKFRDPEMDQNTVGPPFCTSFKDLLPLRDNFPSIMTGKSTVVHNLRQSLIEKYNRAVYKMLRHYLSLLHHESCEALSRKYHQPTFAYYISIIITVMSLDAVWPQCLVQCPKIT
jgi:hypothetical protein